MFELVFVCTCVCMYVCIYTYVCPYVATSILKNGLQHCKNAITNLKIPKCLRQQRHHLKMLYESPTLFGDTEHEKVAN